MPVYALSNFGDRTFDLAEAHFPILKEFDQRFISARLGVMKPDPKIYEILETETGHPPASLLFIDDRTENIEAAIARGWQGHLFTSEAGLAKRLVSDRLLSEKDTL